jgi:3'-phosphoadenosine 5'-phosphosulfate sulfotransferase (PAPS reductase)/FAD synthetase
MTDAPMRVVAYGGGVQSTALLVLAAQEVIDFRTFLIANVGEDSEHPATLAYVRDIAMPYAEHHGITIHELSRVRQRGPEKGQVETLMGRLMKEGSRSIPIPVRMSNGAPGTRSCTADFKIRVTGRWMREHGATEADPATVALGISVDEIQRAKPGIDPRAKYQNRVYPLLDLGLHRNDCRKIITDAGLPVPPKSACFFCPFHDTESWKRLRRDTPDLFAKSVKLEATLNERRAMLGKDPVYLTRHAVPLSEAIEGTEQLPGMGDDCDSGYCFT